jgi:uncharacterized protein YjbI with pentapeptide repeats
MEAGASPHLSRLADFDKPMPTPPAFDRCPDARSGWRARENLNLPSLRHTFRVVFDQTRGARTHYAVDVIGGGLNPRIFTANSYLIRRMRDCMRWSVPRSIQCRHAIDLTVERSPLEFIGDRAIAEPLRLKMPKNPRLIRLVLALFASGAICTAYQSSSVLAGELTRAAMEQKISQAGGGAMDLTNLDLSGLDLSGLKLRKADFFSTKLTGANLTGADLSGANFTRADLQLARLSGSALRGAILYAALLDGADFSGADLSDARIIGGGRGVSFKNAKLVGANLGADPTNQGMVPVRAELVEANFNGADLSGANLTHAVLSSATFEGAILTGARFDYAVLDGTNIRVAQ